MLSGHGTLTTHRTLVNTGVPLVLNDVWPEEKDSIS